MKNFIITLILLSAILVVSLTACFASTDLLRPAESASSIQSSIYPLTAKVVMVDYPTDVVWCEDFNSNIWEFYGCEDWTIGDIVSLLINDNGTEIIYDDEIISARYQGTFEGWR